MLKLVCSTHHSMRTTQILKITSGIFYMQDIQINVATESELVSDEKESYFRAIKLVTLEEKKGNSIEEK